MSDFIYWRPLKKVLCLPFCSFVWVVKMRCSLAQRANHSNFFPFQRKANSSSFRRRKLHTQWVNFINVLRAYFTYEILAPKITKLKCNQRKLRNLLLYEKGARRTLMKLTPRCKTHSTFRPISNHLTTL